MPAEDTSVAYWLQSLLVHHACKAFLNYPTARLHRLYLVPHDSDLVSGMNC